MRHFLLTLAIPIVASFALVGCGEHTHSGEGIELSNVRINPPLPGQTTGVAQRYVEAQASGRHGDTDRLIAVSSSVSDRIELHTHIEEGGVMKMRRVDGIELPHGEGVDLRPGSYHVMMFNAEMALGDEVVLTLDFETADDLTVVAPVVMRGEMRQGDVDHGNH